MGLPVIQEAGAAEERRKFLEEEAKKLEEDAKKLKERTEEMAEVARKLGHSVVEDTRIIEVLVPAESGLRIAQGSHEHAGLVLARLVQAQMSIVARIGSMDMSWADEDTVSCDAATGIWQLGIDVEAFVKGCHNPEMTWGWLSDAEKTFDKLIERQKAIRENSGLEFDIPLVVR